MTKRVMVPVAFLRPAILDKSFVRARTKRAITAYS